MRRILIVIDMQDDFVYGALGTPEARAIVPLVERKIEEYHERGDEVFLTMDTHQPNYLFTHEGKHLPVPHCMFGDHGRDLVVKHSNWDCHVPKDTFGYKHWNSTLFGFTTDCIFELVGVCTDICVISNALLLRSMFPENDIVVDASCCAGTTPERHKMALEVMKSCHIDIINE